MTVTERMLAVKNKLIETDRDTAIEVLTEYIYHVVRSRVAQANKYVLFESDSYVEGFRSQAHLDGFALAWLLDKMKEEGLLDISDRVLSLTALGIKNLWKV